MAHVKRYDSLAPIIEELRRTHSWNDVCRKLGISYSRLRAIMKKTQRDAAMPEWTRGLDIRIANALIAAGFQSKDHVRVAVCYGEEIDRVKGVRLKILMDWLL